MNIFSTKNIRAFTLTEVLVSMFVFSLMMVSVAQIFSTALASYRSTRAVQRDVDNVQYSLNILAKELRTSSLTSPAAGTLVNVAVVQFFDYSQSRCLRYRINAGNLQVASAAAADFAACSGMTPGTFTNISTGVVTGSFRVTPSDSSPIRVGRVTIALDISEGSNHHARMQTTVSLRDFGAIGL